MPDRFSPSTSRSLEATTSSYILAESRRMLEAVSSIRAVDRRGVLVKQLSELDAIAMRLRTEGERLDRIVSRR